MRLNQWAKDSDGRHKTEWCVSMTYRGIVTERNGQFYGVVTTLSEPTREYKVGQGFKSLQTAKTHVINKINKLCGFYY